MNIFWFILFQISIIFSFNSSKVLNNYFLVSLFIIDHTYSIGFKSGLSGGCLSICIPRSSKYYLENLDVCGRALSCIKVQFRLLYNFRAIGSRLLLIHSIYSSLFTFLWKKNRSDRPSLLIAPHTWSFKYLF